MKKIIQFSYRYDALEGLLPTVDCRVLRNPYNARANYTDEQYRAKVQRDPRFEEVVQKGVRLFMTSDTIAVGCTYGRHRSVAVAAEIAKRTGAVVVPRLTKEWDDERRAESGFTVPAGQSADDYP